MVPEIVCRRCGVTGSPHKDNPHLCDACVKAEDSRVSYYRQHNYNWMDVAKEAELELWERQPDETDREWQVWLAYRDAYPGIKPSYRGVAEQLGTTVNVVRKVGQRWSFSARLQAWAKKCDELTMQQRQQEILDMNKRHIDMAKTINEKLEIAIQKINPAVLEPKDITGLAKLATDLERKARIDMSNQYRPSVVEDTNPDLKKATTKTEDLGEVLDILQKAGLLTPGAQVGIRTTTEVVVKED